MCMKKGIKIEIRLDRRIDQKKQNRGDWKSGDRKRGDWKRGDWKRGDWKRGITFMSVMVIKEKTKLKTS